MKLPPPKKVVTDKAKKKKKKKLWDNSYSILRKVVSVSACKINLHFFYISYFTRAIMQLEKATDAIEKKMISFGYLKL